MIRMPVAGIRFTGRSAQGVTVFRVGDGEEVVSVAWIKSDDSEAEDEDGEVIEVIDGAEVVEGADIATEELNDIEPEATEDEITQE